MGVLRFNIHPTSRWDTLPNLHGAFLSTLEFGVVPTAIELRDGILMCGKNCEDAARLHLAWDVPGFGSPILSTASLIQREQPYFLPLELARGKLVQVRNQLAAWEAEGFTPSSSFNDEFRIAHRHFARASSQQTDLEACSAETESALIAVCRAAEALAAERTAFEVDYQQRKYHNLHRLLGTTINTRGLSGSDEQLFLDAFNSLAIPIDWRNIEPDQGEYRWEVIDRQLDWCELHRLIPKGGPLLNFGSNGFPDWLWTWEKDFRNVQSFISDFVETAIERYAGRIRLWEIAARGNSGGALALREEQRLEIIARMLDLARHRDPEAQLILRIDQPWGEYQARGQHRLSPFQFADALVRSGLGLGGVNLEITVGYTPLCAASRDPLDWLRLVEVWSTLKIPLFITLAFPSGLDLDQQASHDLDLDLPSWKGNWSSELQEQWIATYLPPLLASKSVSGVFWDHYSDAGPHLFPHGGLVDQFGKPKPAIQRMAQLRHDFLQIS